MGTIGAPRELTWRKQRRMGRRSGSWPSRRSRPGAPRPSSPWPSRPTPAWAGPACAALGPRPSGLGWAHRHLSHQSHRPGAGLGRDPQICAHPGSQGGGGSAESVRQGLGWLEGSRSRHLKGKLPNFAATRGKSLSQKQPPRPVHTVRGCLQHPRLLIFLSLSLKLASPCTRSPNVSRASVLGFHSCETSHPLNSSRWTNIC